MTVLTTKTKRLCLDNPDDLDALGQIIWESAEHKTSWKALSFSEREDVRKGAYKALEASLWRDQDGKRAPGETP